MSTSQEELLPFDGPPFSLRAQPQRPGEMAELIDLPLDAPETEQVQAAAAAAGLPVELALYITIEAERTLDEAVEVIGLSRAELVDALDAAAGDVPQRGAHHLLVRPLGAYAAALAHGGVEEAVGTPVRVRPPHRVAALWAHTAAKEGVPLERWMVDAVRRASGDRTSWEATAARAGRTLSEWILVQAARCARSRSASPQTRASG